MLNVSVVLTVGLQEYAFNTSPINLSYDDESYQNPASSSHNNKINGCHMEIVCLRSKCSRGFVPWRVKAQGKRMGFLILRDCSEREEAWKTLGKLSKYIASVITPY